MRINVLKYGLRLDQLGGQVYTLCTGLSLLRGDKGEESNTVSHFSKKANVKCEAKSLNNKKAPAMVGELFATKRVISMFHAVPRRQLQHYWQITHHGFRVHFHERFSVSIRGAERQDVALLVLKQITGGGKQHLVVTKAGRLNHVHRAELAVTQLHPSSFFPWSLTCSTLLLNALAAQAIVINKHANTPTETSSRPPSPTSSPLGCAHTLLTRW